MTLQTANTERWNNCKVNPNRVSVFTSVANRLVAAKDRYKVVEGRTGVPWWFIAVVHEREASQSWSANIAQGDPWNRVSVHVPRGRGPFKSWEDAAVDALVNCAPYAAHNKDWSPGGALTMLEEYNGLGYERRGLPSPYIWAGTDQYHSGKYVADGVFDPNAVDTQLGCAGLLKEMKVFDQPTPSVPDIGLPNIGDIQTKIDQSTGIFNSVKQFFADNFKTNLPIFAGGASAFFTDKWPYILAGAVILAGLAWLGFYIYERKTHG